jgi:regulator of RNase E activity RraB
VGLFRNKRRGDDLVDPNDRSPHFGLKYKDLAPLGQLHTAGARLDEPRHVRHFLYFTSSDAAERAAAQAREEGFTCEVGEPVLEQPGSWALVCERSDAVLDPDTVRTTTDRFETLAAACKGDYDGWEAAV